MVPIDICISQKKYDKKITMLPEMEWKGKMLQTTINIFQIIRYV